MRTAPPPRRAYPRKAEIARAIDAARAAGLRVGGIEVGPQGTIRILPEIPPQTQASNPYDQWQASLQGN